MLFGKINPQAVIPQMITPFEQTQIVADYITAIASPYRLGANVVDFQVLYGEPIYGDENVVIEYKIIHQTMVKLSGQAIEDWGTNDETILSAIAAHEGTTIIEFENWSPRNFD